MVGLVVGRWGLVVGLWCRSRRVVRVVAVVAGFFAFAVVGGVASRSASSAALARPCFASGCPPRTAGGAGRASASPASGLALRRWSRTGASAASRCAEARRRRRFPRRGRSGSHHDVVVQSRRVRRLVWRWRERSDTAHARANMGERAPRKSGRACGSTDLTCLNGHDFCESFFVTTGRADLSYSTCSFISVLYVQVSCTYCKRRG